MSKIIQFPKGKRKSPKPNELWDDLINLGPASCDSVVAFFKKYGSESITFEYFNHEDGSVLLEISVNGEVIISAEG